MNESLNHRQHTDIERRSGTQSARRLSFTRDAKTAGLIPIAPHEGDTAHLVGVSTDPPCLAEIRLPFGVAAGDVLMEDIGRPPADIGIGSPCRGETVFLGGVSTLFP